MTKPKKNLREQLESLSRVVKGVDVKFSYFVIDVDLYCCDNYKSLAGHAIFSKSAFSLVHFFLCVSFQSRNQL